VTLSAALALLLALAFVLVLFGVALRLARRFAGLGGPSGAGLPAGVLQRVPLGPRQALAIVRLGERAVVVSVGEGGVRPVTELSADDCQRLGLTGARVAPALAGGAAPAAGAGRAGLAARGMRLWRSLAVAVALATTAQLVLGAPAAAQQGAGERAAVSDVLAQAAGALGPGAGGPAKMSVQFGDGGEGDFRVSGTVGTVLFLGLLAMLPTLLLLMTSFTRVLVVLHFVRQAIGTQTSPPAHLLAAMALLITGFVMAPTLEAVNTVAIRPWLADEIDEAQMLKAGVAPFRAFMLRQTPESDLVRFVEMAGQTVPDSPEQVSLPVLASAFVTSELRAAFQMGFAIFLPFIVIDLVVSAVLTSMGMFMLPPTMIALPCKVLLFVLVDGWSLTVGSLVASFS
jgi:flagellar biosynthetic protein FliP